MTLPVRSAPSILRDGEVHRLFFRRAVPLPGRTADPRVVGRDFPGPVGQDEQLLRRIEVRERERVVAPLQEVGFVVLAGCAEGDRRQAQKRNYSVYFHKIGFLIVSGKRVSRPSRDSAAAGWVDVERILRNGVEVLVVCPFPVENVNQAVVLVDTVCRDVVALFGGHLHVRNPGLVAARFGMALRVEAEVVLSVAVHVERLAQFGNVDASEFDRQFVAHAPAHQVVAPGVLHVQLDAPLAAAFEYPLVGHPVVVAGQIGVGRGGHRAAYARTLAQRTDRLVPHRLVHLAQFGLGFGLVQQDFGVAEHRERVGAGGVALVRIVVGVPLDDAVVGQLRGQAGEDLCEFVGLLAADLLDVVGRDEGLRSGSRGRRTRP